MKKTLVLPLFLLVFSYSSESVFSSTKINISSSGDSSVSVNNESNSESITCINGKCTTKKSESRTKACINDECYESDGDLKIESDSGDIKVDVNNSTPEDKIEEISKPISTEEKKLIESVMNGTGTDENSIEKNKEEKNFFETIFTGFSSFIGSIFSIF